MHSSTSSSSDRIPRAPYRRQWLLAVLLLLVALASTEIFWRSRGFLPSVVDSKLFWCMHRDQATSGETERKIVIIGASRAQLGLDPAALEEALPGFAVIHLAIDGTPPYEILKDLCSDPSFDGVILCSVVFSSLRPADPTGDRRDLTYTRFYQEEFHAPARWLDRANVWIEAFLQSRLVLLSPRLTLRSILASHGSPQPLYIHMQFSRHRPSFYRDRTTPDQLSRIRARREPSLDGVQTSDAGLDEAIGQELTALSAELRSRGGEVVLIRMPTTGLSWEKNEIRHPRAQYWDRVAEWSGIPTIHFRDYPELSKYECPDTSHLDATDVPAFTRDLGAILRHILELEPS